MSNPLPKPSKEEIRLYAKEGYCKNAWFNPEDFEKDFEELFVTRKMITRFLASESLNERLILNKIVMTLNAFGKDKTNVLYRMSCNDVQFSVVKAILMFLGQYDFRFGEEVFPNRIMVDILKDIQTRYNLEHIK